MWLRRHSETLPFHSQTKCKYVIDWFSTKSKEDKRKEAREQELKASLSEKLKSYEASRQVNLDDSDDHTELVVNGKKVRVAKQQITLGED